VQVAIPLGATLREATDPNPRADARPSRFPAASRSR
jgi:hypothetical protein